MTETDRPGGPLGRVAVIVPTYNERANLEQIASRLRTAVPDADLLVVDDNSPDGTGEAADKLAAGDARITCCTGGQGRPRLRLHRRVPLGAGARLWRAGGDRRRRIPPAAGTACAAGRACRADLVIGSRYVPGGTVLNWPKSREVLSRGGNTYARVMLGIKVRDATGGYRAFRATTLRRSGSIRWNRRATASRSTWRCADPGRPDRGRGSDHLRGADPGREQDEPGGRGRGPVAGHPVGSRRLAPAAGNGQQAGWLARPRQPHGAQRAPAGRPRRSCAGGARAPSSPRGRRAAP